MATDQQFCLRWNNHQSTLISVFDSLLENGTLVDCTLAAEGQYLKAHKVVLSACSPYLETLLSQHYEKHPIVILKDVKFTELKSMMDYMYRGEVNISQDQLGTFLKAAESLQIKGLSENGDDARDVGSTKRQETPSSRPSVTQVRTTESKRPAPPGDISDASRDGSISPSSLRKRRRTRRPSQGDDPDSHLDTTSNTCDLPVQAQSTPLSVPSSVVPTPVQNLPKQIVKQEPPSRLDHSPIAPESGLLKEKIEPPSEPLLEPKTEYLDYMNNENSIEVEDLTLDDDEEDLDSSMDTSRPGPSHGDMSNQGYQWPMSGDQSGTDEIFMAAQQAVGAATGQQRDSQETQECPVDEDFSDLQDDTLIAESTPATILDESGNGSSGNTTLQEEHSGSSTLLQVPFLPAQNDPGFMPITDPTNGEFTSDRAMDVEDSKPISDDSVAPLPVSVETIGTKDDDGNYIETAEEISLGNEANSEKLSCQRIEMIEYPLDEENVANSSILEEELVNMALGDNLSGPQSEKTTPKITTEGTPENQSITSLENDDIFIPQIVAISQYGCASPIKTIEDVQCSNNSAFPCKLKSDELSFSKDANNSQVEGANRKNTEEVMSKTPLEDLPIIICDDLDTTVSKKIGDSQNVESTHIIANEQRNCNHKYSENSPESTEEQSLIIVEDKEVFTIETEEQSINEPLLESSHVENKIVETKLLNQEDELVQIHTIEGMGYSESCDDSSLLLAEVVGKTMSKNKTAGESEEITQIDSAEVFSFRNECSDGTSPVMQEGAVNHFFSKTSEPQHEDAAFINPSAEMSWDSSLRSVKKIGKRSPKKTAHHQDELPTPTNPIIDMSFSQSLAEVKLSKKKKKTKRSLKVKWPTDVKVAKKTQKAPKMPNLDSKTKEFLKFIDLCDLDHYNQYMSGLESRYLKNSLGRIQNKKDINNVHNKKRNSNENSEISKTKQDSPLKQVNMDESVEQHKKKLNQNHTSKQTNKSTIGHVTIDKSDCDEFSSTCLEKLSNTQSLVNVSPTCKSEHSTNKSNRLNTNKESPKSNQVNIENDVITIDRSAPETVIDLRNTNLSARINFIDSPNKLNKINDSTSPVKECNRSSKKRDHIVAANRVFHDDDSSTATDDTPRMPILDLNERKSQPSTSLATPSPSKYESFFPVLSSSSSDENDSPRKKKKAKTLSPWSRTNFKRSRPSKVNNKPSPKTPINASNFKFIHKRPHEMSASCSKQYPAKKNKTDDKRVSTGSRQMIASSESHNSISSLLKSTDSDEECPTIHLCDFCNCSFETSSLLVQHNLFNHSQNNLFF